MLWRLPCLYGAYTLDSLGSCSIIDQPETVSDNLQLHKSASVLRSATSKSTKKFSGHANSYTFLFELTICTTYCYHLAMLIQRALQPDLIRLAGQYQVVTIIEPRQSGKSTLARMAFPEKPYVSFEQLALRDFAISDPQGFLKTYAGDGAFLYEI